MILFLDMIIINIYLKYFVLYNFECDYKKINFIFIILVYLIDIVDKNKLNITI